MSRANGYGILQKGVDNMITGQIIQTSIDELKAITKVDLGVYDLNGSVVASTMERDDITTDLISGFAASPADSQVIGVHHLLKIRDEAELLYVLVARGMTDDVYMVGKIAVSQIQNLVIAYKERFDRNNFFQNLLLDNLLLVEFTTERRSFMWKSAARERYTSLRPRMRRMVLYRKCLRACSLLRREIM